MQKKLLKSEAENARLRGLMAKQDNGLLLWGQWQSLLDTQVTEANSWIQNLEAELEAIKKNSETLEVDHSVIREELRLLKKILLRLS